MDHSPAGAFHCKQPGFDVHEAAIKLDELVYDEMMLNNSATGIWPVAGFSDRRFLTGNMINRSNNNCVKS